VVSELEKFGAVQACFRVLWQRFGFLISALHWQLCGIATSGATSG
jgi:hypothetical protein